MQTIRELREGRGWTRLELANRLGVTPGTIYNWERGTSEPGATQFKALAQMLGVPMEAIDLSGFEEGKDAA